MQTCIIHPIRNTFKLASKKGWDALKRDVKPIYTDPTQDAARAALEEVTEKCGKGYGGIIRLWESAWEAFIPFLDYGLEIRTVICSTNAIARVNKEIKRRTDVVDTFPTPAALLRLAGRVLIEQYDEWDGADRRYFCEHSMKLLTATDEGVAVPKLNAA